MKNTLLKFAISAFYEKGFHKTRIEDITNNAETSVGNFYRYFKSKDVIFDTILENLYHVLIDKLQELKKGLKPGGVPSFSRIRNLL